MKANPLKKIGALGQSIWLDYIRRDLISSGKLRGLIENDGLRGMTSNPSIFEKAIAESNIYDQDIRNMALKKKDVKTIYEALSQRDVQDAADEFKSVYEKTEDKDGYVSLEVKNPGQKIPSLDADRLISLFEYLENKTPGQEIPYPNAGGLKSILDNKIISSILTPEVNSLNSNKGLGLYTEQSKEVFMRIGIGLFFIGILLFLSEAFILKVNRKRFC